jgi:hypothetical protein
MEDDIYDEDQDDTPEYRDSDEIKPSELSQAVSSLTLMDDPYLRMQAFNLSVVDQFVMGLEYDVLRRLNSEDRTPPEAMFLNALSQMWIFSAYELLRTWRQWVKEVLKLHDNGGLTLKIDALNKNLGFRHVGREIRADQLRAVLADPTAVAKIKEELRLTHIPFARIEFIRVTLAKHEVPGKGKSIAYAPGYGRINMWCGSLDYQLENNGAILGNISRRDIADELRLLSDRENLPTDEELDSFDVFMKGPPSGSDFPGNT